MARKPGATMIRGYHVHGLPNLDTGNRQPSVRSGFGLQPLSMGDLMCKHLLMEPDGDPEARIRDLERPLADRAHANELGTQPYEGGPSADVPVPPHPSGTPPPPPGPYLVAPYPQYGSPQYGSPQFGSPYYSPPQRVVRKRSPALWLLPVVVGIIVVGTVGAVLVVNFSSFDAGSMRPASPDISGGGGSVDTSGVEIPTPATPVPLNPSDKVVTVDVGDVESFGGIEQHRTIVCNRGTVNISGMTNTVEIQGDCFSVSVSGMDNIVTVESAGSITASGFDNKVTYRAGAPVISTSGDGNVIEQG